MPNQFNGSEGAFIPLTEAQQMTADYRSSSAFPEFYDVKGFFLGKDKLNEIIQQQDCQGIRIYLAIKKNVKGPDDPQIVAVGADADMNDIVANGKILDYAIPCPDQCPPVTSGLDR